MNISADTYFDRMIDILKKKKVLMSEILVLTEAQAKVINSETLDALQKLIEEKQFRIDAIDKLDEEFSVYMGRLKSTSKIDRLEELDTSVYPAAKELKEITGEILDLIGKISETEKDNNRKSKELLDQIGGEIKKINQGKKVSHAYNPTPASIPSYFLDKKK